MFLSTLNSFVAYFCIMKIKIEWRFYLVEILFFVFSNSFPHKAKSRTKKKKNPQGKIWDQKKKKSFFTQGKFWDRKKKSFFSTRQNLGPKKKKKFVKEKSRTKKNFLSTMQNPGPKKKDFFFDKA